MKGDDNDKPDPPIEAGAYLHGTTVVDIGDLRVARGMSRRPYSACRHLQLRYDLQERRVWCAACEHDVEAFDAFTVLVEHFDGAWKGLQSRAAEVREAETKALVSRAAKAVDQVWRGRNLVPCCKVCGAGQLPEDFAGGVGSQVSGSLERARRKRREEAKPK